MVVELEAMAVPLVHHSLAICLRRLGARRELAWIHAQAHGAPLLLDIALLREEVDDRMGGEGVELRRIRVRCVENFAGDVHHRALHSQAEAEIGNLVTPRVARCEHLSLYASMPEASGHDDSIDTVEH